MADRTPIDHKSAWPVVKLSMITSKIGSGATPKGGAESYLPNRAQFALVRSQNVFDRRFEREGLAFITDEQAHELRGARLRPGDILLNITGDGITFGRACIVPDDVLPACVNQHVSIIRVNPEQADAGYVLGFLTHPAVKPYIESFNAGGSRRAITKGHIESFTVPAPPLAEQRAIAHILETLDRKIELNRRISETLESIAREVFKSWFVDFHPVRAKVEGRWRRGHSLPGLPAELYNLFPDRLVESEFGEIPEGWQVGTLGLIAESPRRSLRPDEIQSDTAYIALEHMPRRCIALSHWSTGDGIESNKFEFKRGEVLFGKLRPYFHKVGVAPVDGVCSTDIVVVAQRRPAWFGFTLGHVSSDAFVEYTNVGSTGTKMPRTSWEQMARYEIVIPPEAVASEYDTFARRVVERIVAGVHESLTLAALRDVLLPPLISGEVRVPLHETLSVEVGA